MNPQSLDRFRLVGRTGFVSDDTEQSALLAQALSRARCDPHLTAAYFRRSMIGWFARLPFGIGLGTLRACVRMALGFSEPGVASAGNGAAMRAHVIGAAMPRDERARTQLARTIARLTHTDERAVQASELVATLTAICVKAPSNVSPAVLLEGAAAGVHNAELARAIEQGLASTSLSPRRAAERLGNTGFVVHSMAIASYAFGGASTPLQGIERAICAGGDTDTHAAIVGGWLGGLHGQRALPRELIARIHDGPFGPTHLNRLAFALSLHELGVVRTPRYSWIAALLRNLALYPVILGHGLRRVIQ